MDRDEDCGLKPVHPSQSKKPKARVTCILRRFVSPLEPIAIGPP